jgi:hypothetical protein
MHARPLQATLAALVAVAVAGCGSVRQTLIERGYPPAYAEGYADGCESGKDAAGGLFASPRKDASRYGGDDQYTKGWDAGLEKCQRDTAAMVLDARLRQPNAED